MHPPRAPCSAAAFVFGVGTVILVLVLVFLPTYGISINSNARKKLVA